MKLNCPDCNTPIPTSHINVEKTVAVCPNCGEAFNFADMISTRKAHPDSPSYQPKIKQPEGLDVIETPDRWMIRFDTLPRSPMKRVATQAIYLLMAILGLILSLLVLVNGGISVASLLVAMLPILLIYGGLTGLINKQWIVVSDDKLQTAMRPISMFTGKTVNREDIISVNSQINTLAAMYGNHNQRRYDVDVRLKTGNEQVVLHNLSADYAAFIAQELNLYINGDPEANTDEFETGQDNGEINLPAVVTGETKAHTSENHSDHNADLSQRRSRLEQ
ncbi:MAG TPA: hypothetical protein VHL11_13360 [Phototrophicaceae bacterium]|jgi:hypothetical protein|nr:hypothetical protein [Phototrophicaceae bacterium]